MQPIIFGEALDVALGDDEDRIPLRLRPVTRDILTQDDPHHMVAAFVDGAVSLYERAGPLIATYQGSAGADAEMRRHADAGAHEARRIMSQLGQALHEIGGLRPDLSPEQAGDALLALSSPQVHQLLREQCGWTASTYRSWLLDSIERTIIAPD